MGTTARDEYEIDRDAAGTPTGRAGLKVNNGNDPAGYLKFNRDTNRWEYSNDGGGSWWALGEVDLSLAAQQFTKYVPQDDPPLVYSEVRDGGTLGEAYELIDLTDYLGAPQFGVNAVVLRVFFRDSAPGSAPRLCSRRAEAQPVLPRLSPSGPMNRMQSKKRPTSSFPWGMTGRPSSSCSLPGPTPPAWRFSFWVSLKR